MVPPRLGLGMAALGRPGYINLDRGAVFGLSDDRAVSKMQDAADLVMDRLFALTAANNNNNNNNNSNNEEEEQQQQHVPWLDCARSYGLSEKFVGEYLRGRKVDPGSVYVSSKWGYTYVADWNVELGEGEPHEVKDHSAENFLKQVEETNELLGEYVDLYQIHSATFESGILTDENAHRALAQCRKERGWSIGLSVSSPKQGDVLAEAMKITVDGTPLFDSVQCTYNLLEQRPGKALEEAKNSGISVIVKEGLANGRILRNPDVLRYAKELGCEPDQLALGCVLAQPFRPSVLSGAVTPQQIESNWKAQDVAEELRGKPDLLREIMDACRMDSEEYWNQRAALAWN